MMKRIVAGVGANSFGLAVTVGIQLFSLPVFLHYWSNEKYGAWLILSAIPAYLSMADVGMVTAAGNKMAMAMGQGDAKEANRVFQSTQLFMWLMCALVIATTLPLLMLAPLPGLTTFDQRIALAAMVISVLLSLVGGLPIAVYKATHRYPTGIMMSNFERILEWLLNMLALAVIGTFSAVALSSLVAKVAGILFSAIIANRGGHGMRWGVSQADRHEIFDMFKPAVSFMAFPLANALSFQGVTLVVGMLVGTGSVTMFNAYRTIARIAVQMTALLSHALWPEFSRLYGEGGNHAVRPLFRKALLIGAIQAVAISAVLYFATPLLLKIWTHGHIGFESGLMSLMLVYALIGGVGHVPRVFLQAINRHTGVAGWSLFTGAVAVALAWFLIKPMGIHGAGWAMLVSELIMTVVCVHLAYQLLNQPDKKGNVA